MKLPKTIVIAGKRWVVKQDKTFAGGEFRTLPPLIIIGTKHKENVLNNFIHEVLEVILTERGHRYCVSGARPDENGNLLFSFTHKEFEHVCCDLASVLENVI